MVLIDHRFQLKQFMWLTQWNVLDKAQNHHRKHELSCKCTTEISQPHFLLQAQCRKSSDLALKRLTFQIYAIETDFEGCIFLRKSSIETTETKEAAKKLIISKAN